MRKRKSGMFDDYDEDEFLLFMQEEGNGGSSADDYEMDELRLFLREEGDRRGTTRAKPSGQKNRETAWLCDWDWHDDRANRKPAKSNHPDQTSAEILARRQKAYDRAYERYKKACEQTAKCRERYEAMYQKVENSRRKLYERLKKQQLSGKPLSDRALDYLEEYEKKAREMEDKP